MCVSNARDFDTLSLTLTLTLTLTLALTLHTRSLLTSNARDFDAPDVPLSDPRSECRVVVMNVDGDNFKNEVSVYFHKI